MMRCNLFNNLRTMRMDQYLESDRHMLLLKCAAPFCDNYNIVLPLFLPLFLASLFYKNPLCRRVTCDYCSPGESKAYRRNEGDVHVKRAETLHELPAHILNASAAQICYHQN